MQGKALWSEIQERGSVENLDTNLLFEVSVQKPACASQIVSHILHMWRLTRKHSRRMHTAYLHQPYVLQ